METRGKLCSRREQGLKRERRLRHIFDFILLVGVAQKGRGKGSWTETPEEVELSRGPG